MPSIHSKPALVAITGLLATLASLNEVAGVRYFQSSHKLLSLARIDPIVAPGGTSKHLHKFVGAETLSDTVTYESLRAATKTTAEVVDDKSLYWQPTMYWKDASGKFHLMQEDYGLEVYWFGRYEEGEILADMPGGLRMTAGDPKRSTYDSSSLEDQHIGFSCYCMGIEGSTCDVPADSPAQFKSFDQVKSYACDVVRLETMFPNCWDGTNVDSNDHKSHMAYTADGESCPTSHPHRIPTVFLEGWYYTDKTNWPEEGELVLSTGDTVGYSIHGDFFNGWGEGEAGRPGSSLLVRGLNDCPEMNGAAKNCATYEVAATPPAVQPVNDIFQEEIGTGGVTLDKLPGDNPLWGSGSGPTGGTEENTSVTAPSAGAATGQSAGVDDIKTTPAVSTVNPAAGSSIANTAAAEATEVMPPAADPSVIDASPIEAGVDVTTPIAAEPTAAAATAASASTHRYRGGYRGSRSSTLPVNNAIALPSPNVTGNNFAMVSDEAVQPTKPAGTCNMKKRATRSRARQQL